jgi:hypothetical protein
VIGVSRGFRGLREINTVTYDPAAISPQAMEDALKAAGTFAGRAED